MLQSILASALLVTLPPTSTELDGLVQKSLDQWQVPGLALAIVRDDRVVHLKGYGKGSLDAAAAVTPDTIFPLASCTKPFTTALLAMLVDDGKLGWHDPVRKHLPFFRLKDPLASERATLCDLLCHRTGLGAHQHLWYRSPLSLEDRVRKLAFLDPVADFRTEFHYQTVAFGAAGLAAERATESSWEKLMTERVLRPLGMKSSSATEPDGAANLASPHRRDADGRIRVIARYALKQPDPAGSIHATARDLTPFLRMQLAGGVLDDASLLSPFRMRELHQPLMVIPVEGFAARLNPETVQISYGLGWIVQDYRGRKMILHGGAIDGFRAHLVLVPELGLGIGILSNLDGSLCNFALANTLVDRFLEAPPRAWSAEIHKMEDLDRKAEAARADELRKSRPPGAAPPRPLADYAGLYEDAAYGQCRITKTDRGLEIAWRSLRCPLEHFKDSVFIANEPPFRDAPVEFVFADGKVAELRFLERVFARNR